VGAGLLSRFFDWVVLVSGITWWMITSSEGFALEGVCDLDVEPKRMADARQSEEGIL